MGAEGSDKASESGSEVGSSVGFSLGGPGYGVGSAEIEPLGDSRGRPPHCQSPLGKLTEASHNIRRPSICPPCL